MRPLSNSNTDYAATRRLGHMIYGYTLLVCKNRNQFLIDIHKNMLFSSCFVLIVSEESLDSIGSWLTSLGLSQYEASFVANGYDDIRFIVSRSNNIPQAMCKAH